MKVSRLVLQPRTPDRLRWHLPERLRHGRQSGEPAEGSSEERETRLAGWSGNGKVRKLRLKGPPSPRGDGYGAPGTLEGNKAHGRIGRHQAGNGRLALRTRRWRKALKSATPLGRGLEAAPGNGGRVGIGRPGARAWFCEEQTSVSTSPAERRKSHSEKRTGGFDEGTSKHASA
jgi:hypothetical protein